MSEIHRGERFATSRRHKWDSLVHYLLRYIGWAAHIVSFLLAVLAEPSPWVYEKIHLLSDEDGSPERVKKFQIPSDGKSNATQKNQTSKANTPQNTTLATHDRKPDDNQTDAVAKLYSFLKFTSQVKDNATAHKSAASREDSASNSTAAVTGSSNQETNSTSEAALADDNETGGASAASENHSDGAATSSQQNIKTTASQNPQTSTAQSNSTSLGVEDKGTALAGYSSLGAKDGASIPQTFSIIAPVRPVGLRASIPKYPASAISGHAPVSIVGSRSFVSTWPKNSVPNKAVYRPPVPVPQRYAANGAVFRSPVPAPVVMSTRPANLGQHGYLASHAALRSPVPGQTRYMARYAGMRTPVPRRAMFLPNQVAQRRAMTGYAARRAALRSPIPGRRYTAYWPRARAFNVPRSLGNPVKQRYAAYRGPVSMPAARPIARYRSRLPYARQNAPYPFKSSVPFLAPGQKRTYLKSNRSFSRAFVPRPAYTRTQVLARPLGVHGWE